MLRRALIVLGITLALTGCSTHQNQPVKGTAQPVSVSEFITENGNIECDNAEIQGHRTEHLAIKDADPIEQGVTCFVKKYTGPTAGQPCDDLNWFTVHLEFGSYPTTYTCAGEEPMELSPNPYVLKAGMGANLGGATCSVTGPGVTCESNAKKGVFFTVSATDITIPIAPGDTVKFAASGLADNAQVRPPNLQISVDSSFEIAKVNYTSWTQHQAAGTGTLIVNRCVPTCAAGNDTEEQIAFTLNAPVLACGSFFFTAISWRPTAGDQKAQNDVFGPPDFDNMAQETPCDAIMRRHS